MLLLFYILASIKNKIKMNLLRLKEVLKERSVSGKDLAERVDVSAQTISNIIQGSNFPKPELLKKIADELGVDIRELFNPTKDVPVEPLYVNKEGEYVRVGFLEI